MPWQRSELYNVGIVLTAAKHLILERLLGLWHFSFIKISIFMDAYRKRTALAWLSLWRSFSGREEAFTSRLGLEDRNVTVKNGSSHNSLFFPPGLHCRCLLKWCVIHSLNHSVSPDLSYNKLFTPNYRIFKLRSLKLPPLPQFLSDSFSPEAHGRPSSKNEPHIRKSVLKPNATTLRSEVGHLTVTTSYYRVNRLTYSRKWALLTWR